MLGGSSLQHDLLVAGPNKEYVERFAYTGPKEYLNALQCEVFEHYKKPFPTKADMYTKPWTGSLLAVP